MAVKTGPIIGQQWSFWADLKYNCLGGLYAQHVKMDYVGGGKVEYCMQCMMITALPPSLRYEY